MLDSGAIPRKNGVEAALELRERMAAGRLKVCDELRMRCPIQVHQDQRETERETERESGGLPRAA